MDELKPLYWVGTSKKDLKTFPEPVQREIGFSLFQVQEGKTPENVKPLKGITRGVFEIVSRFDKNTYRCVYAIKIADSVYVLHSFQKKSKSGIKTPKQEIDLVKQRLAIVKENTRKN